jgi:DeoR/GlpR family transcriptional regulator of sugar metabolism
MNMLKQERHNFIVLYMNLYGKTRASVLCDILKVSHYTIRRDFRELSEQGMIVQVHGGALAVRQIHLQETGT